MFLLSALNILLLSPIGTANAVLLPKVQVVSVDHGTIFQSAYINIRVNQMPSSIGLL